jgi:hypothetical protein
MDLLARRALFARRASGLSLHICAASTLAMEAQHERVTAACAQLAPTASTLRNGISSHKVKAPAAFSDLDTFATQTLTILGRGGADRVFVGSVDGELLVSARLHKDCPGSVGASTNSRARLKKRGRDDSDYRADKAVADIRKRAAGNASLDAAVSLAHQSITSLLRDFKGVGGEEIVESCALSLAPPRKDGAGGADGTGGAGRGGGGALRDRPRLIIACRLSAGVPLPLAALRGALGKCFADGMVTTRSEALGEAYRLPLSAAGQAVENQGQRSLLLFAAVPLPHVEAVRAVGPTPAARPAQ